MSGDLVKQCYEKFEHTGILLVEILYSTSPFEEVDRVQFFTTILILFFFGGGKRQLVVWRNRNAIQYYFILCYIKICLNTRSFVFFSPLVVTESSTRRRRLISVACVTETIHPAGDLPEHSTRQGLVRFARMLSEDLALRYALRRYALRYALRYTLRYALRYALCHAFRPRPDQFDPFSLS